MPNPIRMCDSCGGVDDHPRHVHGVGPDDPRPTPDSVASKAIENAKAEDRASILTQIRDETTVVKHMDCCAEDGCPDGSCDKIHASYDGEPKKGDVLRKHLTSGKIDKIGEEITARNFKRALKAQEESKA